MSCVAKCSASGSKLKWLKSYAKVLGWRGEGEEGGVKGEVKWDEMARGRRGEERRRGGDGT